ncbi:NUDIX domain-containing protein [Trinickia diaoshuihuensis]|uniref:NUDIX domain-containing protein n=1 Tax=Trinickia diaoshuihuensis TaxID=2292265 RepID=UPI000E24B994|nr:NUDIX domain-containing protein [Trinickia diaoshuihuensis]
MIDGPNGVMMGVPLRPAPSDPPPPPSAADVSSAQSALRGQLKGNSPNDAAALKAAIDEIERTNAAITREALARAAILLQEQADAARAAQSDTHVDAIEQAASEVGLTHVFDTSTLDAAAKSLSAKPLATSPAGTSKPIDASAARTAIQQGLDGGMTLAEAVNAARVQFGGDERNEVSLDEAALAIEGDAAAEAQAGHADADLLKAAAQQVDGLDIFAKPVQEAALKALTVDVQPSAGLDAAAAQAQNAYRTYQTDKANHASDAQLASDQAAYHRALSSELDAAAGQQNGNWRGDLLQIDRRWQAQQTVLKLNTAKGVALAPKAGDLLVSLKAAQIVDAVESSRIAGGANANLTAAQTLTRQLAGTPTCSALGQEVGDDGRIVDLRAAALADITGARAKDPQGTLAAEGAALSKYRGTAIFDTLLRDTLAAGATAHNEQAVGTPGNLSDIADLLESTAKASPELAKALFSMLQEKIVSLVGHGPEYMFAGSETMRERDSYYGPLARIVDAAGGPQSTAVQPVVGALKTKLQALLDELNREKAAHEDPVANAFQPLAYLSNAQLNDPTTLYQALIDQSPNTDLGKTLATYTGLKPHPAPVTPAAEGAGTLATAESALNQQLKAGQPDAAALQSALAAARKANPSIDDKTWAEAMLAQQGQTDAQAINSGKAKAPGDLIAQAASELRQDQLFDARTLEAATSALQSGQVANGGLAPNVPLSDQGGPSAAQYLQGLVSDGMTMKEAIALTRAWLSGSKQSDIVLTQAALTVLGQQNLPTYYKDTANTDPIDLAAQQLKAVDLIDSATIDKVVNGAPASPTEPAVIGMKQDVKPDTDALNGKKGEGGLIGKVDTAYSAWQAAQSKADKNKSDAADQNAAADALRQYHEALSAALNAAAGKAPTDSAWQSDPLHVDTMWKAQNALELAALQPQIDAAQAAGKDSPEAKSLETAFGQWQTGLDALQIIGQVQYARQAATPAGGDAAGGDVAAAQMLTYETYGLDQGDPQLYQQVMGDAAVSQLKESALASITGAASSRDSAQARLHAVGTRLQAYQGTLLYAQLLDGAASDPAVKQLLGAIHDAVYGQKKDPDKLKTLADILEGTSPDMAAFVLQEMFPGGAKDSGFSPAQLVAWTKSANDLTQISRIYAAGGGARNAGMTALRGALEQMIVANQDFGSVDYSSRLNMQTSVSEGGAVVWGEGLGLGGLKKHGGQMQLAQDMLDDDAKSELGIEIARETGFGDLGKPAAPVGTGGGASSLTADTAFAPGVGTVVTAQQHLAGLQWQDGMQVATSYDQVLNTIGQANGLKADYSPGSLADEQALSIGEFALFNANDVIFDASGHKTTLGDVAEGLLKGEGVKKPSGSAPVTVASLSGQWWKSRAPSTDDKGTSFTLLEGLAADGHMIDVGPANTTARNGYADWQSNTGFDKGFMLVQPHWVVDARGAVQTGNAYFVDYKPYDHWYDWENLRGDIVTGLTIAGGILAMITLPETAPLWLVMLSEAADLGFAVSAAAGTVDAVRKLSAPGGARNWTNWLNLAASAFGGVASGAGLLARTGTMAARLSAGDAAFADAARIAGVSRNATPLELAQAELAAPGYRGMRLFDDSWTARLLRARLTGSNAAALRTAAATRGLSSLAGSGAFKAAGVLAMLTNVGSMGQQAYTLLRSGDRATLSDWFDFLSSAGLMASGAGVSRIHAATAADERRVAGAERNAPTVNVDGLAIAAHENPLTVVGFTRSADGRSIQIRLADGSVIDTQAFGGARTAASVQPDDILLPNQRDRGQRFEVVADPDMGGFVLLPRIRGGATDDDPWASGENAQNDDDSIPAFGGLPRLTRPKARPGERDHLLYSALPVVEDPAAVLYVPRGGSGARSSEAAAGGPAGQPDGTIAHARGPRPPIRRSPEDRGPFETGFPVKKSEYPLSEWMAEYVSETGLIYTEARRVDKQWVFRPNHERRDATNVITIAPDIHVVSALGTPDALFDLNGRPVTAIMDLRRRLITPQRLANRLSENVGLEERSYTPGQPIAVLAEYTAGGADSFAQQLANEVHAPVYGLEGSYEDRNWLLHFPETVSHPVWQPDVTGRRALSGGAQPIRVKWNLLERRQSSDLEVFANDDPVKIDTYLAPQGMFVINGDTSELTARGPERVARSARAAGHTPNTPVMLLTTEADAQRHPFARALADELGSPVLVMTDDAWVPGGSAVRKNTVTVSRVEGAQNKRVQIDEDGNVSFLDTQQNRGSTVWLNFGPMQRSLEYFEQKRGTMDDVVMQTFEVPRSLLDEIRRRAVHQGDATAPGNEQKPVLGDWLASPDQFGLRWDDVMRLQEQIIPGSAKTIVVPPRAHGPGGPSTGAAAPANMVQFAARLPARPPARPAAQTTPAVGEDRPAPLIHPRRKEDGTPVEIETPTQPSDPSTWHDPAATAVFVPDGAHPAVLNGVPMTQWEPPATSEGWQTVSGQNPDIVEPPADASVKKAGVVILEPDGRVWIIESTNHFTGPRSFPKGSVDEGLSLQATAIKEGYEETGLHVELLAHLTDFKTKTGKTRTRYYLARRIGGNPAAMGWETQGMYLVPRGELAGTVRTARDLRVVRALLQYEADAEPLAPAGGEQAASDSMGLPARALSEDEQAFRAQLEGATIGDDAFELSHLTDPGVAVNLVVEDATGPIGSGPINAGTVRVLDLRKGDLPKGSGHQLLACALEQADVRPTQRLVLDDVEHPETIAAREAGLPAEQTPLARTAMRALTELGLTPASANYEANARGHWNLVVELAGEGRASSPDALATDEAPVQFKDPDALASEAFLAVAQQYDLSPEAIEDLQWKSPRDNTTKFFDARQGHVKATTVSDASRHVAATDDSAYYISADIYNLGGLNAAFEDVAEHANVHYEAMARIAADALEQTGAKVVPMRTGGDELGFVVVGAVDDDAIAAALGSARERIADYAEEQGLADIPHPKRKGEKGVGMHFGSAPILPGLSLSDIFTQADLGVNRSKTSGTRPASDEPDAADEDGITADSTAAPPAARPGRAAPPVEPFGYELRPTVYVTDPAQAAALDYIERARRYGLTTEQARSLVQPVALDDVSGFFDARQASVKSSTVNRTRDYVSASGGTAYYVSGDIYNLGGLNAAMNDVAELANAHYRSIVGIVADELAQTGADVIPMRTGGDEVGIVVAGQLDEGALREALQAAQRRLTAYAEQNGLTDIPHPKREGEYGVGMHLGYATITESSTLSEIFTQADKGVNRSKTLQARLSSQAGPGGQPPEVKLSAPGQSGETQGQGGIESDWSEDDVTANAGRSPRLDGVESEAAGRAHPATRTGSGAQAGSGPSGAGETTVPTQEGQSLADDEPAPYVRDALVWSKGWKGDITATVASEPDARVLISPTQASAGGGDKPQVLLSTGWRLTPSRGGRVVANAIDAMGLAHASELTIGGADREREMAEAAERGTDVRDTMLGRTLEQACAHLNRTPIDWRVSGGLHSRVTVQLAPDITSEPSSSASSSVLSLARQMPDLIVSCPPARSPLTRFGGAPGTHADFVVAAAVRDGQMIDGTGAPLSAQALAHQVVGADTFPKRIRVVLLTDGEAPGAASALARLLRHLQIPVLARDHAVSADDENAWRLHTGDEAPPSPAAGETADVVLGYGNSKVAYALTMPGEPPRVVTVLRDSRPADTLEQEQAVLEALRNEGVPVLDVSLGRYLGRPAVFSDRYATSYKALMKAIEGEPRDEAAERAILALLRRARIPITPQTAASITRVHDALVTRSVDITDFDMFLGRIGADGRPDGRAVVADPLRWRRAIPMGPHLDDLPWLSRLVRAAAREPQGERQAAEPLDLGALAEVAPGVDGRSVVLTDTAGRSVQAVFLSGRRGPPTDPEDILLPNGEKRGQRFELLRDPSDGTLVVLPRMRGGAVDDDPEKQGAPALAVPLRALYETTLAPEGYGQLLADTRASLQPVRGITTARSDFVEALRTRIEPILQVEPRPPGGEAGKRRTLEGEGEPHDRAVRYIVNTALLVARSSMSDDELRASPAIRSHAKALDLVVGIRTLNVRNSESLALRDADHYLSNLVQEWQIPFERRGAGEDRTPSTRLARLSGIVARTYDLTKARGRTGSPGSLPSDADVSLMEPHDIPASAPGGRAWAALGTRDFLRMAKGGTSDAHWILTDVPGAGPLAT